MKRHVILVAAAGSLMIASAAAVFLFRAKSVPSAGARPVISPFNAQSPQPNGHTALAVIAADNSRSAEPAVASSAASASGDTAGGRREELLDPRLSDPAQERIQQRITEALRTALPEVPGLLAQETPHLEPDQVYAAILHALDAEKSVPYQEQPLFLLAADYLADKLDLPMKIPPAPETRKKLDELAQYGIVYRWSELGASWVYSHGLLWRVWRDYPASPWADDAFVLLLSRNWDSTFDCRGGADSFRAVIREGEDFLATHPQSRYRIETSYLVAQAYETWWSLSRAKLCRSLEDSDCDEFVDPDSYRQGAEEARGKAIGYYEQVLQIAPAGNLAADARRHLTDAKQGLDTVQRRFYCIYD
jgi:hypothetical protein